MTFKDGIRPLALAFTVALLCTGLEIFGATVHQVSIENGMKFVPAKLVIQAGDTVEFTNRSVGSHTVTADPALVRDPKSVSLPAGAAPFNSGLLAPGAKFSQLFTVSGHYKYTCLPHERMGMQAEIEVASVAPQVAVDCSVQYSLEGNAVAEPVVLRGAIGLEGGVAISEDFTIGDIVANLHVFHRPTDGFTSINFFHEPTQTYLNGDIQIMSGTAPSLQMRTHQIASTLDQVGVFCRFH